MTTARRVAPLAGAARRGRAGHPARAVRPVLAGVAALLTAALLAGCSGQGPGLKDATPPAEQPSPVATKADATTTPTPEQVTAPVPEAEPAPAEPVTPDPEPVASLGVGVDPAFLSIPDIEVSEDMMSLGIKDDGAMQVPNDWDRVGWFTGGGRPGGRGPTVIAGHVDSPTGPAVFYRLTELEIGDRAEVTYVDGVVHTYEVYRVENFYKDDYPTREVFGALATDELRLVTCTGEFDTQSQRHDQNRVVFARAVTG